MYTDAPVTCRPGTCNSCEDVAAALGIKLATRGSCRQVTIENIAEAARHLGVPLMKMFEPL